MTDRSNGASGDDAFVELFTDIQDTNERLADAVEENTKELRRLADALLALAKALQEHTQVTNVDHMNAGVAVALLRGLFPNRITAATIVEAANDAFARLRDSRYFTFLAVANERLKTEQKHHREREERKKSEQKAAAEKYRQQMESISWDDDHEAVAREMQRKYERQRDKERERERNRDHERER